MADIIWGNSCSVTKVEPVKDTNAHAFSWNGNFFGIFAL